MKGKLPWCFMMHRSKGRDNRGNLALFSMRSPYFHLIYLKPQLKVVIVNEHDQQGPENNNNNNIAKIK